MGKLGVSVVVAAIAAATLYIYPSLKGQTDSPASVKSSPVMVFNVTVIRHGETDFNVNSLIHSSSDGTINAVGVQQAKELGQSLQEQVFTRIYSSDLQRCQDTAQNALEQLKTPVPEIVLDKRLRERDYGEWDGQPSALIWKMAKEKGVDVREITAPGGETFEESYKRVVNFLEELLALADKSEQDENIAIFSHGISIQYLLAYLNAKKDTLYDLENFTYDRWKFAGNTAVTRFSVGKAGSGKNGKRKIVFYSIHDDSHVKTKSDVQDHAELVKKIKAEAAAKGKTASFVDNDSK